LVDVKEASLFLEAFVGVLKDASGCLFLSSILDFTILKFIPEMSVLFFNEFQRET